MGRNIIELIDGKYVFNKNNLLSSLKKVSENDFFAVIPVIGENNQFLNKYLNKQQINNENHNWLVRISSDNIVLKTSYQKTSVLLLESRLPLQFYETIEKRRVVQHIYGLFFKFSSTVLIIFDRIIKNEEIQFLQQILDSNHRNSTQLKPYNEVFIVVNDWDPKAPGLKHKNYLFGSKGGEKYLKNEFKDSKLEDYFKKVSCFFLPPTNTNDYPNNHQSLLDHHLFNIDEMQVMKVARTNDNLKVEQFVDSIESYVESLNQTLLIGLGLSANKLFMECTSGQTSETPSEAPTDIHSETSEVSFETPSDLSEELKRDEFERIDPGFNVDEIKCDELYEIIEQCEIAEIKNEMDGKLTSTTQPGDSASKENIQFNWRTKVRDNPTISLKLPDSILLKEHQVQSSRKLWSVENENKNKSSRFPLRDDLVKSSVGLSDNLCVGIQEKLLKPQFDHSLQEKTEYSLIEKPKVDKFEMMGCYQYQSSNNRIIDDQGVSSAGLVDNLIANIQERAENQQKTENSLNEKPKDTKVEMREFCLEKMKTYDEISDKVLLEHNNLVKILNDKSIEISGELNSKFFIKNLSDLTEIKEELRKMIKQKENEIKDKIEKLKNTRNSIELYKNQMETQLKQHFSHLNNDFTQINFELIDKNSEIKALSSLGAIIPEAVLLELKEKIKPERKIYQDIIEPLNQYTEQWKSHIKNDDQDRLLDLEQLNERLMKLYFDGLNDLKIPVITDLIKLATDRIFAKVKQNYQQKQVQIKQQIRSPTRINLEDHKPWLETGGNLEKIAKVLNHYDEEVQKMIESNLFENLSWINFKAMDAQVSNNCTWMFQNEEKPGDSDIKQLSNELEKKKQDYFKAIEIIIKYRDEWTKDLQNNTFIEPCTIYGINQEKVNKLIIPENLSKFIRKQFNIVLEAVIEENQAIINCEKQIAQVVIEKVLAKFSIWLDFKIKSDFYNQDQFENFYEELIKHSINSLKRNFDYKSNQNYSLIQCETQLNEKLCNQKTVHHSNYSKNMAMVKILINDNNTSAVELLKRQLTNKYPDYYYEDKRQFDIFSEELKTKSFELNKQNMRKIKTHLNDNFYHKLNDKNIQFIMDQFERLTKFYYFKEKKTYQVIQTVHPLAQTRTTLDETPKTNIYSTLPAPDSGTSSIVILFGKEQIFSICVEHNSIQKNKEKEHSLTRPNCIRIIDQYLLIGQDAKRKSSQESFDVKNLLFIRGMKEDKKRELLKEYPFEFTMDNKVKYRAINQDLSIESLIALQVLDIKSETERQVNTNVTNAVFIVPTNYTIRQFEDFRNIAILSGFREHQSNIVTQINCAAIGFAEKMKTERRNKTNVLIISLNEYECDSAVCQINDYNINYKSFLNENLISNINTGLLQKIFGNDQDLQYRIMTNFKCLIAESFRLAKTLSSSIEFVVLSGTSPFLFEIKQHIKETFKIECNYDPVDIILEGAAYSARSFLANDHSKVYKFHELIKQDIRYRLKTPNKNFTFFNNTILFSNNKEHGEQTLSNVIKNSKEFPFEIKFYQDDCLIANYLIGNQVTTKFISFNHYIKVDFLNNEHKLLINSWLTDKDNTNNRIKLNVKDLFKLDQIEIERQKNIIKYIVERF